MSGDFLLEIGVEEIPSGYLDPALQAMKRQWLELMEGNRITFERLEVWGTPRRLALMAEGMPKCQSELVSKTMGPPMGVAFDKQGNPTKAATGFAARCGVTVQELQVENTGKGEYLFASKVENGKEVYELLPLLIPDLIKSIPFPKSMRWGQGDTRFVRPVHWLLCLLDARRVDFRFGGVPSGNLSWGHRFMAPGPFEVREPGSYLDQAEERFVLIDLQARKETIRKDVEQLAATHGGEVCWEGRLLEQVTNLVEYPVAVWGGFDEAFLELPREVLTNTMVKHQRYFPVQRPDGKLMPNFITVSNTRARDMIVVAQGNSRVLRARLADAMFFFKGDTDRPLADFVPALKGVLYQEKLGTSHQKMERFQELALYLGSALEVGGAHELERAAYLCKADLVTRMVVEFPNLQGIMGREYALLSGEKEEVAEAVFEHYLPRHSGDRLPATSAGAVLSLADKLDTIVGSFGVGMKPTGNVDPHGIRRQAIGVIKIIIHNDYRISLSDAVGKAVEILAGKMTEEPQSVKSEVLEFFARRMESLYLSEGFRYDLVDAVMGAGFDDLASFRMRLKALTDFSKRPDFEALTTTFKRVVNIIPAQRFGDARPPLFAEEAERELYAGTVRVGDEVEGLLSGEHYIDALTGIANLRETVDRLFDTVLVMADDMELRRNRLALLCMVAGLFDGIADFSKVVANG